MEGEIQMIPQFRKFSLHPARINKAELWWCIDGPPNASHALINHAMLAGFDNRLSLASALSLCVRAS